MFVFDLPLRLLRQYEFASRAKLKKFDNLLHKDRVKFYGVPILYWLSVKLDTEDALKWEGNFVYCHSHNRSLRFRSRLLSAGNTMLKGVCVSVQQTKIQSIPCGDKRPSFPNVVCNAHRYAKRTYCNTKSVYLRNRGIKYLFLHCDVPSLENEKRRAWFCFKLLIDNFLLSCCSGSQQRIQHDMIIKHANLIIQLLW